MRTAMIILGIFIATFKAQAMNIRMDIDINVMNGDGTLAAGDKNNTSEERGGAGSNREDNSSTETEKSYLSPNEIEVHVEGHSK